MMRNRPLLLTLSAAVVFVTTYLLVLPAMTLDAQQAEKQGGIDLPAEQSISFDGDGFAVSADFDAKAGLPQGTELAVSTPDPADAEAEDLRAQALEAIQAKEGESSVSDLEFAGLWDISLMAEGEPVEPRAPVDVTVSYDKPLKISDADHLRIVHFGEDGAEVLDPQDVEFDLKKGKLRRTAFAAESFSVYAVVYTVDFEYSVNGKMYQFSLSGGEIIALSELIEVLSILDGTKFADTDAFLKEVKGVEFSDPALVKVTQMEGDWELESLEPFTTEESLTITMKNGDVITVKVTDDQESSNLIDFLTKVTVSGASVVDGHYVVEQGKTYNVTMNFKETANLQFDNEGNLTYNLPEGITLPEGTTKTIKIAVVSGGKTYEIPATVTANGTTVTVKFDETDPNYNKLAQATNVGFRVSVDAQFTENINKTQWGSKMDKDIILDTTDHSDAFAEKSGHFDESTGVFHYTVKVKANGDVTNVNVKDIISGNALIFNNNVQVTGNSSSYTDNGLSAGQKGFDYTFTSMADGEEIIITYSASLDQTVAKNSDTITADQTKNTVTVQKQCQ